MRNFHQRGIDTLETRPLNISVVALESTLGPTILKIVPITAHIITSTIAILYLPTYDRIFLVVPLKSFAFSPGIIPCPPGPRLPIFLFFEYSLFSLIRLMPPLLQVPLRKAGILQFLNTHGNSLKAPCEFRFLQPCLHSKE